jgi:NAD(P)-dependent dehydrogenase (short-subunit alcohol dehydrogenase family)
MNKPLNILLVDAQGALAQSLAAQLREAGHRVLTHGRDAGAELAAEDLAAVLPGIEATHGALDRIVFCTRGEAEQFEAAADVERTLADLARTLGELKAAAQLLTRRDDSQLWVLLHEDSMQYYLPVPAQPVRSRALMAAVKSIAKELYRFGVRVNALQVQPCAEELAPAQWRAAKDGLKAFALKFKPQGSAEVAAFLQGLMVQPQLPLVGMVLPVGIGYPEANV